MLVDWWFSDKTKSGPGIDAAAEDDICNNSVAAGSESDVVSVCVLVVDAADAGSNSTSDGSTTVAQTTAPVQQVHSVDENTMKTPVS